MSDKVKNSYREEWAVVRESMVGLQEGFEAGQRAAFLWALKRVPHESMCESGPFALCNCVRADIKAKLDAGVARDPSCCRDAFKAGKLAALREAASNQRYSPDMTDSDLEAVVREAEFYDRAADYPIDKSYLRVARAMLEKKP